MMNFKKFKLTYATLIMLTVIGVSTETVLAEEAAEKKTTGHVSFIEDTETNAPVDPMEPGKEEPGTPINPIDPTEEFPVGTNGPLSIDFASYFDFGEQKISTRDQTYTAAPQQLKQDQTIVERPNYVQVTDKRGEQTGWTLSVKQDAQFKGTKTGKDLTGAEIVLKNPEIASVSESVKPEMLKSEIILAPGKQQSILSAKADAGFGTWIYRFGNDDNMKDSIKLNVPGSSVKQADEYKVTIVWSLSNIPEN